MSIFAGQKLRQARQRRSLSLEQAAQATRIRPNYLSALEEGDLEALPSMAQARGFLRAYASYLGLDGEALLAGQEQPQPASPPATPQDSPQKATPEVETEQISAAETVSAAVDSPPVVEHQPLPTTPAIPSATPSKQNETGWEAAQPAFAQVGKQLRQQRELLGLSLEDVERHTHLRQHYLNALEEGNMDWLPSPVQGRGMLNNYATFLGLDPDPLLLRFADGLQMRLQARQNASQEGRGKSGRVASTDISTRRPSLLRRIFAADFLVGVVLFTALVGFVGWSAIRIFAMQNDAQPTATAPSIVEVLLASPTATLTFTPVPVTPTLPLALQPPGSGPGPGQSLPVAPVGKVQIYISVRQRAWMRVLVDGEIEFEGRVLPGSAYTFVADSQVEILTGNGAALQVFYNQTDLGLLGSFGQIVNRIYTLQAVLNPTPTITPTILETEPIETTPTAPAPGEATAAPTQAPALP